MSCKALSFEPKRRSDDDNLHNCPHHAMSSSDDRVLRAKAIIVRRKIAELGIAT
jgi:hypothetical protein